MNQTASRSRAWRLLATGVLAAALLAPGRAKADDFRYVDREGRVHLIAVAPPEGGTSNSPSPSEVPWRSERPERSAVELPPPPPVAPYGPLAPEATSRYPRPWPQSERPPEGRAPAMGSAGSTPYIDIVREAAVYYGLPPELIVAVMRVESAFNPRAVSRAGAMGLMQLMPATAEDLCVTDPYDPRQSILGGARLLRVLVNRFEGSVALALAGYNAGPGAVEKWGGIPPYPETMDYVVRVLTAYHMMLSARIEAGRP